MVRINFEGNGSGNFSIPASQPLLVIGRHGHRRDPSVADMSNRTDSRVGFRPHIPVLSAAGDIRAIRREATSTTRSVFRHRRSTSRFSLSLIIFPALPQLFHDDGSCASRIQRRAV